MCSFCGYVVLAAGLEVSGRLPFVAEGHQQLLCSEGLGRCRDSPPTALVAQDLYPPLQGTLKKVIHIPEMTFQLR